MSLHTYALNKLETNFLVIDVLDASMTRDIHTQCVQQNCDSNQLSKNQTVPKAISPFSINSKETSDLHMRDETPLQVANSRPSTPMNTDETVSLSIPCTNLQTPTKSIHNLRFVSEIRTPHLATPRRARKALQLAKWTIAQQRRKIKTLTQARNRLVARVTTMKDLIKHLQKKNLLSEAAAANVQVSNM